MIRKVLNGIVNIIYGIWLGLFVFASGPYGICTVLIILVLKAFVEEQHRRTMEIIKAEKHYWNNYLHYKIKASAEDYIWWTSFVFGQRDDCGGYSYDFGRYN